VEKHDAMWGAEAGERIAQLEAENTELRAVVRDLLESYLASFGGNKDELAFRAERLLKD